MAETDSIVDKSEQKAFNILVERFDSLYREIRYATKITEKRMYAAQYGSFLKEYMTASFDLNVLVPEPLPLNGTPVWFASVVLLEAALDTLKTFDKRYSYLDPYFTLLKGKELEYPISRGRCLTGLATEFEAFATANWLVGVDPFVGRHESTVTIPAFYCFVDKRRKDYLTEMALHIGQKLLDKGESIHQSTRYSGLTPLMRTAIYTNVQQAKWLLEKGADPNKTDSYGASALVHAISPFHSQGDFNSRRQVNEYVELLLEWGASMDFILVSGQTFGDLLTPCKPLSKEYKKLLRTNWKTLVKGNRLLESRRIPLGEFSVEDKISPADIRKFEFQTEFLLHPYSEMLTMLLEYLYQNGVQKFTLNDIKTLVDPKWNGVNLRGVRVDLSEAKIESSLGKLIMGRNVSLMGGSERLLNLSRDFETGWYSIVQSNEANVVHTMKTS
ncbi:ankyrin repeat domain-containing protein [Gynuella sp.]|uniref:ankyrin repeat domain-containing protein n=1 Tax=Gynuella sp. TaxID=2969146 RepID=UPI003D09B9AB